MYIIYIYTLHIFFCGIGCCQPHDLAEPVSFLRLFQITFGDQESHTIPWTGNLPLCLAPENGPHQVSPPKNSFFLSFLKEI